MVADHPRLGPRARQQLLDPDNERFISAASVWEAEIKMRLGRLTAPDELWVELERSSVSFIAIDRTDAVAAAALPPHHRDPFDRMLIAQAARRDALFVTADRWADPYDVRVLPADR